MTRSWPELRRDPLTGRWVILAPGRVDRPHDARPHHRTTPGGPDRRRLPFLPRPRARHPARGGSARSRRARWAGLGGARRPEPVPHRGSAPPTSTSRATSCDRAVGHGRRTRSPSFRPTMTARSAQLDDEQVLAGPARAAGPRPSPRRGRTPLHAADGQPRRRRRCLADPSSRPDRGHRHRSPHGGARRSPTSPTAAAASCAASCKRPPRATPRSCVAGQDAPVWCPWWSSTAFELLLAPRRHRARFEDAGPELEAVAVTLREGLARLDRTLGDPSYNLIVHTLPADRQADYHWHIHIRPRLQVDAGFELGTGILVNTVDPVDAARQLRSGST